MWDHRKLLQVWHPSGIVVGMSDEFSIPQIYLESVPPFKCNWTLTAIHKPCLCFCAVTCLNFELSAKNSRWLALSFGNWGSSAEEGRCSTWLLFDSSLTISTYIPKYRRLQEWSRLWWYAQWYCYRSVKLRNESVLIIGEFMWGYIWRDISYLCFSLCCVKREVRPNLPGLHMSQRLAEGYRYNSI